MWRCATSMLFCLSTLSNGALGDLGDSLSGAIDSAVSDAVQKQTPSVVTSANGVIISNYGNNIVNGPPQYYGNSNNYNVNSFGRPAAAYSPYGPYYFNYGNNYGGNVAAPSVATAQVAASAAAAAAAASPVAAVAAPAFAVAAPAAASAAVAAASVAAPPPQVAAPWPQFAAAMPPQVDYSGYYANYYGNTQPQMAIVQPRPSAVVYPGVNNHVAGMVSPNSPVAVANNAASAISAGSTSINSFGNVAGGTLMINSNNGNVNSNRGCVISNGQLYVNGVLRGAITPAQQAQLTEYERQVSYWGNSMGASLTRRITSGVDDDSDSASDEIEARYDATFPRAPAFCTA